MSRTKQKEDSSNVTFALTNSTNAKLSMLVHDPTTGKAKYGLKSKVTEQLLKRLFQAVVEGEDSINVRDLRIEVTP